MKKIKLLSAFFMLCGAVSLTSCNSDDSEPVNNNPTGGTFTVSMDGESYVATQAQAVKVGNTISVAGARGSNGESVAFIIPGLTAGTYTTGNLNLLMYYQTATEGTEYVNMNPATFTQNGTVTVTSVANNTISGTFSFTAYSQTGTAIEFTNGSFTNVPVSVGNPQPVTQGSVSAFVNGVQKTFAPAYYMHADGKYIITGMNMTTFGNFQLSLPDNVTTGSYAITSDAVDGIYSMISNGMQGPVIMSQTGTVTITGNSGGWLDGTFTFTGTDMNETTYQVTGGQFHVQLQE